MDNKSGKNKKQSVNLVRINRKANDLTHYIGSFSDGRQFMAMEVSTPDVDGTALDDETATQLFIVTTAMIGLMARSIKE